MTCWHKGCTNWASFWCYQAVKPQLLADGTLETEPAGRSNSACGKHLPGLIRDLDAIAFKLGTKVTVTVRD